MVFLEVRCALLAASTLAVHVPAAASAQSSEVGTFQCHLSGGVGMILVEKPEARLQLLLQLLL